MYNRPFDQIDKSEFLSKYWQKAPCFFKDAFNNPPDFLSADELAGLSLQEEIESRLILQSVQQNDGAENLGRWSIEHGPFSESRFTDLPESHWTLLVQSVDSWISETRNLLKDFNFIPRWRFDDIMISYATDQGGVGPHADNYDVFLIQGSGHRHWRVGTKGDTSQAKTVIQGMCHVAEFEPQIDILMQPGDMLYIPPDTAHWGISIGESIGYSIGYRSIQTNQLLALLTEKLAETIDHQQFFSDSYRNKPNSSNFFEEQLISWAQNELKQLANQPELLADLLSKQLSLSKLGVYQNENNLNLKELNEDSIIQLDDELGVNWLYIDDQIRLNIEGESFDFELQLEDFVKKLASFSPISLTLYNFSAKLVDFPPVLTSLINRGYVKQIK